MASNISADPHSRVPRAELILAAAIALVSLLVIALTLALRGEDPAHARTLQTVAAARTVRDETLALAQSTARAASARADALLHRGGAQAEHEAAKHDAYARIETLRGMFPHDSIISRRVDQLRLAVETTFKDSAQALAEDPSATPSEALERVQAATETLIAAVNALNDEARQAETRLRARVGAISVALAALSLIASALAIFSLRREREQWRLANALAERARRAAAASDMAKTRFLTAASHDMRQPLHALTLYLSALRRRVTGDEAQGVLAKAERAAQSLTGMFAVLLDLARIEANVVTVEFADIRVGDIFDRLLTENPNADIMAQANDLHVRSDPVLLERILRNLVSNGLRHGGDSVSLSASANGDFVDIRVADQGPGIRAEDQQRVFDEFVRLENRNASEGLGLGLAIVKRLAGLLGHEVRLKSALGGGAEFTITVRRARPIANPPAANGNGNGTGNVSLAGLHALVMDDDAQAREAMAGALADLGAEVRACADLAAFNTALETNAPDLIVLDLRVGGKIVGLNAAETVRARLGAKPRIVIVTGDTGTETLAALRASGYRWLVKPIDPRDLAAAVS